VLFCPNCGSPLTPEHRFCPRCGAPITPGGPPQAPQPQDPGYPYPPPPAPGYPSQQPPGMPPYQQGGMYPPGPPPPMYQQPRGGSGKRIVWIIGGVLLIAAIVGVLWMTGVIFGIGPKESVERFRVAYEKGDLPEFDKYFDSESVLSDFLDQAAAVRAPDEETKQVRAHLPEVADAMKRALLGLPVPAQSPEVEKLTKDACESMRETRKRIAYKSIASESRTGADAIVGVIWGDASGQSTKTVTLDFKMRRSGSHWKAVAIQNLAKAVK
jgi:hypothetical protein